MGSAGPRRPFAVRGEQGSGAGLAGTGGCQPAGGLRGAARAPPEPVPAADTTRPPPGPPSAAAGGWEDAAGPGRAALLRSRGEVFAEGGSVGAEGPRPGRVGRLPRPDGGVRSRSASIPRLGKGNPALLCLCTAAFRHGVAPSRGLGRRSFPGRAAPGCPACPGAERARLSPGCGAAPRPCHALPPPTRRPLLSGSK